MHPLEPMGGTIFATGAEATVPRFRRQLPLLPDPDGPIAQSVLAFSVEVSQALGSEVEVRDDALTTVVAIPGLAIATQPGRRVGVPDSSVVGGERFWFCGRGCLLDFQDDPSQFLDAGYQPSGM